MICIIFCGDIRFCPYLSRYTDRLESANSEYEVLFWNRAGLNLRLPTNYKYYDISSAESLGEVKKLIDFLGFRKWVKKKLKFSDPSGVIFLSTLSAVLLWDITLQYKKKYIFDIRDYSYEHIKIFNKLEYNIIKNSYFTAISSKGFKSFLPKYDYVIAHNFNRNNITHPFRMKKGNKPYKIVWNGTIRFFDYQRQYLDIFKNDMRFVLIYHGVGTDLEKYKKYCAANKINNIFFTGEYDNKEKENLLSDADILNNCYGGRNGDQLRYAISNRFYDGLIYHIPQIVEDNGFKANETSRLQVGFPVKPTRELPDRLAAYYEGLDVQSFNEHCDSAIRTILLEDDVYITKIDDFIRDIER